MKKSILLLLCVILSVPTFAKLHWVCSYKLVCHGEKGTVERTDKYDIDYTLYTYGVGIEITNKTDSVLVVDWDKCTITHRGQTMRVIHAGVKFTDRNSPQVQSVIPPKGKISDTIYPVPYISYVSKRGWVKHPILWLSKNPGGGYWKTKEEQIPLQEGMKIGILMAISIENKIEFTNSTLETYNFRKEK